MPEIPTGTRYHLPPTTYHLSPTFYNQAVATTGQRTRLVLLDSHGILFRAFFALGNTPEPLRTSSGELTFATYGFAETLLLVLDQLKPTHIAAAWDMGGKTFRHEADATYKATRRATPDDLIPQMARTRELLGAFNIPIIEMQGYEADDVLGTLGTRAAEEGIDTYLVTLDTDLVQLVRPNLGVFMFRPYQRDTVTYDQAKVAERWGFEPQRMIDFKALKGDTSDNVPGVKGIGDKGATQLIQQFGTLESIYEHLDDLKPAQRKRLEEGREAAFHSKEMVTIVTDMDIDFDIESSKLHDFDRDRVIGLFRELEFRRLLERAQELLGGAPISPAAAEAVETNYATATTGEELKALAATVREAGSCSVVALTTAGFERDGMLLGIAVATEPGRAWYVPVGHAPRMDDAPQPAPEAVVETLGPVLSDPAIAMTTFDAKLVHHVLDKVGVRGDGIDFDGALASFLLGQTNPDLGVVTAEWLGIETTPIAAIAGTGRKAVPLVEVDRGQVADLACQWADHALRLRPVLAAEIEKRGQQDLLADMELPLVEVLFRMERTGVALDVRVLSDVSASMIDEIASLEREIYDIVGHEFNIGSPKQLSDVLFSELGLPKTRKTASGYSTDQRALEGLRQDSPIIDAIFQYRELTKLKSTYCDALPGTVADDGRIHTDFQQMVAATGRLSSTNPNLQNIPVRTEIGRKIRHAFVARGYDDPWFVAADYSQIELRVLAEVSGDSGLLEAFLADQDIHQATAAAVYGVEPGEVTREMRDTAKMVNFGIAYGMGDFGLASRTGMSRADAGEFIRQYYERFPGIRDWQERTLAFTREKGYAETLFGRRRFLPAVSATNFQVRSAAEREAINMPIQGTAADIIKVAMIRIDEAIRERELSSTMLLQVHDELIFECPADEADAVAAMAVEIMPASLEMRVPLKVDVKRGRNWGEME